jgi:membrane associated rhomboid family serine protease
MFPLQDTMPSRGFPFVTWIFIVVNVLVFIAETQLGTNELEVVLQGLGVVPVRFLHDFSLAEVGTVFSSMFLHGGFAHLIGNMWFLHIFGDNVEDRMGSFNYLVFYMMAGFCAAITQLMMNPGDNTPMIGASGAISGVLGAYLVLFPEAKVITMIPVLIIPYFVRVPAIFFLGLWFVMEFFSGFFSLAGATADDATGGGVAFWAHVGGFVFGMVVAVLFVKPMAERPRYRDEYEPW